MAMGLGIMAPFRRKAVGVDFFNHGAPVGARTKRKKIVAAFDPAKQHAVVEGQGGRAVVISSHLAAPDQTACAAPLKAMALDRKIRLAGNRDRQTVGSRR